MKGIERITIPGSLRIWIKYDSGGPFFGGQLNLLIQQIDQIDEK